MSNKDPERSPTTPSVAVIPDRQGKRHLDLRVARYQTYWALDLVNECVHMPTSTGYQSLAQAEDICRFYRALVLQRS